MGMDYRELKKRVVGFVEAQRVKGGPRGAYRNGPKGEVQIIASTDAAMTLAHFGELKKLSEGEKDEWAAYLNSFQTEEGYYWPTGKGFRDLVSARHRWDYVMGWFTRHAMWALNLLERPPARELRFADRFVEEDFLKYWVADRKWDNVWLTGNELLEAYSWLQTRAAWFKDDKAKRAMRTLAELMGSYMDGATGYWGTKHGSSVFNGMGGYIHITPIIWDQGLEAGHAEEAIDSTMSLQQADGFFGDYHGSMCYDFDGVYALANLTLLTEHRRAEVQDSLRRAVGAFLTMQNADGGFKDYGAGSFGYMECITTPAGASASTGTWMYSAAIGLAAAVMDESPFKGEWEFSPTIGHLVCVPGWPTRRR